MMNVMEKMPTEIGPREFWQAVLHRDRRFQHLFVYGVRSTGVYCRPTCASRRPRREQVSFFAGPEAAERAGFRACRRCRPSEIALRDPQAAIVQKLCRYIDSHIEEPVTLSVLRRQAGMSEFHLQRTFKRVLGVSPLQYARVRRLLNLKTRLKSGDDVTSAMYAAGYGSSSRLYEHAAGQLGMTPGAYRGGGAGAEIKYALATSKLGRVLVAATRRGVCAVRMGDSDSELVAGLRGEFPLSQVREDSSALGELAQQVIACVNGGDAHPDIPLDIRGTAFQARVWEALRRIPRGETRSYAQIAKELKQPSAVRAVARACAMNPVAVIVPCHRVVRSDGGLGGYRWGIERKQELLASEAARD
jgi:AraC family transcriptional regulator, regulatory protein of adaptative response / methylated-DNA-[protein]-cysteine methyltransferase